MNGFVLFVIVLKAPLAQFGFDELFFSFEAAIKSAQIVSLATLAQLFNKHISFSALTITKHHLSEFVHELNEKLQTR